MSDSMAEATNKLYECPERFTGHKMVAGGYFIYCEACGKVVVEWPKKITRGHRPNRIEIGEQA